MATRTDPRFGFKYGWDDGQDGWGSDNNTNIENSIYYLQVNVIDKDLTTPPGSPSVGDRYIVPSGATGDWSGKTNELTIWWQDEDDGAPEWKFPLATIGTTHEGFKVWVADEDKIYVWSGTAWICGQDTFILELKSKANNALGNSHSISTKLRGTSVPKNATLVSCKFHALAITAGTGTGVDADVYLEGTGTILSAEVDIAAANTVYDGSISISSFSEDDILTLRVETASDADATDVTAVLEFQTGAVYS
jgi:hypothetical protein